MTANRKTWLDARRGGIGGTDAAKILGVSPYGTALDVFLEKTGAVESGEQSEAARWGQHLEPIVLREAAARLGLQARPGADAFPGGIARHPDDPVIIGSVDGLLFDGGDRPVAGLEVKTISAWKRGEIGLDGQEADDETCPDAWRVQVYHYAYVTGIPVWYVAVLVGGQELRILRVEPEPAYGVGAIPRLRDFWVQHVAAGVPPPRTAPALVMPVPKKTIEIPESLLREYHDAAATEAKGKAAKKLLRPLLVEHMGDAAIGIGGRFRVTRSGIAGRISVDSSALERDYPEVYQAVARPGAGYDQLRIREVE